MGVFGRRTKSKLKENQSDYLTVSTPRKLHIDEGSSTNERKDKTTWKMFRGFHSKKNKKLVSPRSVLLEDQTFDIGCIQKDGDTSYEVSFLTDNTLASPSKPETFINGRSLSPIKLNTSVSFSSFILGRSKRKNSQQAKKNPFDPNEKSDIFDDFYEKEEAEKKQDPFENCYANKQDILPARSASTMSKSPEGSFPEYDNLWRPIDKKMDQLTKEVIQESIESEACIEEESTICGPQEKKGNENNIAILPSSSSEVTFDKDVKEESKTCDRNASGSFDSSVKTVKTVESDEKTVMKERHDHLQPNIETRTEDPGNSRNEDGSFIDVISCQPLSQFFACATSLDKFEKMLFGDDIIPQCLQLDRSKTMSTKHSNEQIDIPLNQETISNQNSFQKKEDDPVHNQDTSYDLVDTFLSQATKTGIELVYYEPMNAQESEWDAHDVTLYLTPGRRDEHVSVPPKLMWVARNNARQLKKNVYHHFDLGEIDSVMKPEEESENSDGNEDDVEAICFSLITKKGQVYIFEARNVMHRNFIVDSLQVVVSRLAFV